MKNALRIRRAISILLMLAMLLSIIPFAAFADDSDDAEPPVEVIEIVNDDSTEPQTESEEVARGISEDESSEDLVVEATDAPVETVEADIPEEVEDTEPAPDESVPAEDSEEPVTDVPDEEGEPPVETPEDIEDVETPEDVTELEPENPVEAEPESEGDVQNADGSYTDSEGHTYFLIDTGTRAKTKIYKQFFSGIFFSGKGYSGNFPYMAKGSSYSEAIGQTSSEIYAKQAWVYCIDYNHSASSGEYTSENINNAPTWRALSPNVKKQVTLALVYGARIGNNNNHYAYVATQTIVWQYQYGGRTTPTQNNTTITYSASSSYDKSKIDYYYNLILSEIAAHYTPVNLGETSHEFENVGEEYKVQIADKNNVLASGDWTVADCPDGVSAKIVNGKLEVYATERFEGSKSITLRRKTYTVCGNAVALHVGEQWAVLGIPDDPDRAVFKVSVKAEQPPQPIPMTIVKQAEDGSPAGFQFKLYQQYTHTTWYGVSDETGAVHVADSNFNATDSTEFEGLTSGVFYFKEFLGARKMWPDKITFKVYDPNGNVIETQTFTGDEIVNVDGNPVIQELELSNLTGQGRLEIIVHNATTRGTAMLKKIASDGYHDGFQFHLYNQTQHRTWYGVSDVDGNIYSTDEHFDPAMNGESYVYEFTSMKDGTYFFVEHDPGVYVPGSVSFYLEQGTAIELLASYTTAEIREYTAAYDSTSGNYYIPPVEVMGLNGGGKLIIEISNIRPDIQTDAWVNPQAVMGGMLGLKTVPYNGTVKVTDIVTVDNTVPGDSYHTVTFAKNSATGDYLLNEDGTRVEAVSESFNGLDGNFKVMTYLTINTEGLETGDKITLCQELWDETLGMCVAVHEDVNDERQQLTVDEKPEMHTTATWQDGSKVILGAEARTVLEKCYISDNVPSGSYTMKTILWDLDSDKPLQEKRSDAFELKYGYSYEFETSFDVTDVDPLPKNMVVLEYLYASDDLDTPVLIHDDKDDQNQTVKTASVYIHTMAHDAEDASLKFLTSGVIADEVYITIEGAVEPGEYQLTGQIMERITNEDGSFTEKELLVDGSRVYAFTVITLNEGETTATVAFQKLALDDVAGKTLVVYEDLYRIVTSEDGTAAHYTHIAEHHDIEDEDQTIYVPTGHTEASVTGTTSQHTYVQPTVDLTDIYYYENLIPGEEYELEAYVTVKKLDDQGNAYGEILLNNDAPIVVRKTFVAEAANGHVEVTVTVPALVVDGTQYVFGENLWYDGIAIHVHYDVNDEDQTITLHELKFGTVASVNGSHSVYASGKVAPTDTVNYTAVEGTTLLFKATLCERVVEKNGKVSLVPFISDGTEIVGEATVKVTEKNGSVTIQFPEFSAEGLQGRKFVVVEEAYLVKDDGTLVHLGTEDNPDNEDQTITFYNIPNTGDENDIGFWTLLLAGCIGILFVAVLPLRKKSINGRE